MADAPSPRSIEELLPAVIDPRDYGAVGDGTADDTDALQATFDTMRARPGVPFLVAPGTYRVTRPIAG